jgi:hypothetical protein
MDPTDSLSKGIAALSVGDQNTPHDSKDTTPSLTRVSPKHDLSIDEDHNKLDAHVMKTFSVNRRYNEEPPLDALLTYITVADKRLVTLTPEDAQELPSIRRKHGEMENRGFSRCLQPPHSLAGHESMER